LWLAIVLPGLLLRALIPLGFMPMFGPGLSMQLTLCEGYAPLPSKPMDMSSDTSMDMSMSVPAQHHLGPEGGGAPSHQDHNSCPYGASSALAALPTLTHAPVTVQVSAPALITSPQVAHFEIAARAQSPRGPPLAV